MNERVTPPGESETARKLRKALALAKLGMYIAPLRPNSKQPYGEESWSDMRTRDLGVIEGWFRDRREMNYAVVPGENFVVLDLDTKKGKDGHRDLNALALEAADFNGDYENTFVIRTPSGGAHLYYRAPWPVSVAHTLPRSIDVRGNDGYVVGPGCTTPDGEYVIEKAAAIAALPDWIEPRLQRWIPRENRPAYQDSVETIEGKQYVDGVELDTYSRVGAAVYWLANTAEPAIEYQGGNETTYRTFAWLREHAISSDMALHIVLEHYNPRCVPSWTDEELIAIRDNAYKYAKRPVTHAGGMLEQFADEIIERCESVETPKQTPGLGRWANDGLTIAEARRRFGDTVVLVDMVLLGRGVVGILAETGSGKTVFLTTLAQSLAHDMDFLDFNTLKGYSVAYCMGEGHESALDHLEAFLVHYEVPEAKERLRVFENVPKLLEPSDVTGLTRRIREVFPGVAKLVVIIDTWQRATAEAGSQSDDAQMVRAFEQAEKISQDLGDALVIVALHPPKGDKNTASGAQQIINQLENLLNVKKPDEVNGDRERKVKLGKDERDLFVQKLRAFGELEHYTVELELKELPGAANAHGRKPTGRVAVRKEGPLSAVKIADAVDKAQTDSAANGLPEEIEASPHAEETARQRNNRRERHKLFHAVISITKHIDDDAQATANARAAGRQAQRDMLTAEAAAEMLAGTKLKDDDGTMFEMDQKRGLATNLKRWFDGDGYKLADGRWLRFVSGTGRDGKRRRVLDVACDPTGQGADTPHA